MRPTAMFMDMYELTMAQGYFLNGMKDNKVTFEMFYRRNPFNGGYIIFAGLNTLLEYLETFTFSEDDIEHLKKTDLFQPEFLAELLNFRFKGEIYSPAEGTMMFPQEPLLYVKGGLMECSLVEGLILNTINFQSLIATKASRMRIASKGKAIIDFGLRRAQGFDGAMSATRAMRIGGISGTSNLQASTKFGIPCYGTMAHAWVMAYKNELEAFHAYAKWYPRHCILLVDTFDTLKSGIPNAINTFKMLRESQHIPQGFGFKSPGTIGIRIDSGDLEYLSKEARKMLDDAGFSDAFITVSNDLDESIISTLEAAGSPIDSYGVGTNLITAKDCPALGGVYKLVENNGVPVIKLSNNPEKVTNPGEKQVIRFYNQYGQALADIMYMSDEAVTMSAQLATNSSIELYNPLYHSMHTDIRYDIYEHLFHKVYGFGEPRKTTLEDCREIALKSSMEFHKTYTRLVNPHVYKVGLSKNLFELKKKLMEIPR